MLIESYIIIRKSKAYEIGYKPGMIHCIYQGGYRLELPDYDGLQSMKIVFILANITVC